MCKGVGGKTVPSSFPSENLGEKGAIKPSLHSILDIRITPGRWSWTESSRWPPVNTVLANGFWSKDCYKPIREGLLLELPNPVVHHGGDFVTVDLKRRRGQQKAEESAESQPAAGEPEDVPPPGGVTSTLLSWLFFFWLATFPPP